MTNDTRQDSAGAIEDSEEAKKPATQPNAPNPKGCKKPAEKVAGATAERAASAQPGDLPTEGADNSKKPEPCEPTPDPDDLPDPPDPPELPICKRKYKCPPAPTTQKPDCLDDLISAQEKEIKEAERATSFKDELKAIQDKTRSAKLDYTQTKYDALKSLWKKQDGEIVELLRQLVCRLPDWRCMVECSVCELIYAIRDNERLLSGTGVPFTPTGDACYKRADSLYDLQYWHERNVAARKAEFDRIKLVLAAWEKPAQTIEKALADNAQILAAGKTVDNGDLAKFVYDVFFVLIPRHLAVAPPREEGSTPAHTQTQTQIQRKYYDVLCHCDEGTREDCCGPNTGQLTLRERLVGPLPYLITPELYSIVVCCLVECRYVPAKDALAAAEGELAAAQEKVRKAKAFVEEKFKSLENDAKANLLDFKCPPQDGEDTPGGDDADKSPQPPAKPATEQTAENDYA